MVGISEGRRAGMALGMYDILVFVLLVVIVLLVVGAAIYAPAFIKSAGTTIVNIIGAGVGTIVDIGEQIPAEVNALLANAKTVIFELALDLGTTIVTGYAAAIDAITTLSTEIVSVLSTVVSDIEALVIALVNMLTSFYATAVAPVVSNVQKIVCEGAVIANDVIGLINTFNAALNLGQINNVACPFESCGCIACQDATQCPASGNSVGPSCTTTADCVAAGYSGAICASDGLCHQPCVGNVCCPNGVSCSSSSGCSSCS